MSATSVRGTNDDATVSKLSAARLGYYEDPFLEYFVSPQAVKRRAPLINRGYWSRVAAIYEMVSDFMRSGPIGAQKQIVNLGAGFDTMFFRLKAANRQPLKFFEIDYPETVLTKTRIIKRHRPLWSLIAGTQAAEEGEPRIDAASSDYALVGADLCDVKDMEDKLRQSGLNPELPTLFLSECVLVYLKPEDSTGVIEWASRLFKGGAVFISYEQINPWDPFGQTMLQNLKARGCSLLGLETFPDLDAQRKRFESRGWRWWNGWDMNHIYRHFLPRAEVVRIEKLELFDELEEWHMIQGHYCIQVAACAPSSSSLASSASASSSAAAADKEEEGGQHWLSRVGLLGASLPSSSSSVVAATSIPATIPSSSLPKSGPSSTLAAEKGSLKARPANSLKATKTS